MLCRTPLRLQKDWLQRYHLSTKECKGGCNRKWLNWDLASGFIQLQVLGLRTFVSFVTATSQGDLKCLCSNWHLFANVSCVGVAEASTRWPRFKTRVCHRSLLGDVDSVTLSIHPWQSLLNLLNNTDQFMMSKLTLKYIFSGGYTQVYTYYWISEVNCCTDRALPKHLKSPDRACTSLSI